MDGGSTHGRPYISHLFTGVEVVNILSLLVRTGPWLSASSYSNVLNNSLFVFVYVILNCVLEFS